MFLQACKEQEVTKKTTDPTADLVNRLNSFLEGRIVTMRDPDLWLGDDTLGIHVRRFVNPNMPEHQVDVDVTVVDSFPVQSVNILVREVNTRQVIKSLGFHKSDRVRGQYFAVGCRLSPTMTYTLEAV